MSETHFLGSDGQTTVEFEDEGRALEQRCCSACCCCDHCFCTIGRWGAAAIWFLVSVLNILTLTVCIYLLSESNYYGEKFNLIFLSTINAIMMLSQIILLHGFCTKQRNYIMSWVFLFGSLLFLQNVVGVAAVVVAVVNKASALYVCIFIAMGLLDVIYIYSMIGVCNFCRGLGEYTEIP